jgi:hypothetical protein
MSASSEKGATLVLSEGPFPVEIESLGEIRLGASYSSRTEIWPVGFSAVCRFTCDPGLPERFRYEILDNGDRGPIFRITLLASLPSSSPEGLRSQELEGVKGFGTNEPTTWEAHQAAAALGAMIADRRRVHGKWATTPGALAALEAAVVSEAMAAAGKGGGASGGGASGVGAARASVDAEERALSAAVRRVLARKIELAAAAEGQGFASSLFPSAGAAYPHTAAAHSAMAVPSGRGAFLGPDVARCIEGLDGALALSSYRFTEQRGGFRPGQKPKRGGNSGGGRVGQHQRARGGDGEGDGVDEDDEDGGDDGGEGGDGGGDLCGAHSGLGKRSRPGQKRRLGPNPNSKGRLASFREASAWLLGVHLCR